MQGILCGRGLGVDFSIRLFILHDPAVVRHLSHRVAVMYNGEIVEWGDDDQVTSDLQHEYTMRLMMAAPVPDPDRQAARCAERQAWLASRN